LIGPDTERNLTVFLRYSCARNTGSLRIHFSTFARVELAQNIVSLEIDGRTMGYVFTAENPLLIYDTEEPTSDSFKDFFSLGIEHIWSGYDHLLFLLALLLPGGALLRLAGIVTAFTLAHSVTLALAALDIVRLPSAPVEILIAATIIWAASLSLRAAAADTRWRMTFVLGLVHGFGFAGILGQAGLSADNLVVPLLGFNAGVEVGQLVVVAIAIPAITLLGRSAHAATLKRGLAWLIVAAGVFWVAERSAVVLAGW